MGRHAPSLQFGAFALQQLEVLKKLYNNVRSRRVLFVHIADDDYNTMHIKNLEFDEATEMFPTKKFDHDPEEVVVLYVAYGDLEAATALDQVGFVPLQYLNKRIAEAAVYISETDV
jgi:hypothetical protein